MFRSGKTVRAATAAFTLAGALSLAGCAGDGIEIQGPGFHIGGDKKKAEAKVPDRAPLLVPPDRARLPQPHSQSAVAAVQQQPNWPSDADVVREQTAIEAKQKKRDYEDHGDWSKKADIDEFEKLSDRGERMENGLLDRWFKKTQEDAHKVEEDLGPGN